MTVYQAAGIAIGMTVLIGIPVMMVWSGIDHRRRKASQRPRGSASAGFGAALQELDRVVRPSVEHVVDAQTPSVRQVDQDGD